jgi:hypothetical protein
MIEKRGWRPLPMAFRPARWHLQLLSFLLVSAAFGHRAARPEDAPSSVWSEIDKTQARITIHGLDAAALVRIGQDPAASRRWSLLCPIILRADQSPHHGERIGILGSYRANGTTLHFYAKYALDQSGYRILINSSLLPTTDKKRSQIGGHGEPFILDLDASDAGAATRSPTVVTAVYPSAKVLPENLLRFYIHFSAPMSRGEAYKHIHLLRSTGEVVADPFLELNEELWSPDGRRFTLLLDPGRIKRGLKPRREVGPVLEEGKSYTLCVDERWPDSRGEPLASALRRTFHTGPPEERELSPRDWTIHAPAAGTCDPVVIQFPRPLDSALAQRLLVVKDGHNHFVRGSISLESEETRWLMRPELRWSPGEYRLEVAAEIEDIAGNGIGRPFEVDLFDPISARVESKTVSLPFRIEPAAR